MSKKSTPPRRAAPPPDQSAYARGLAKFRRDFGEPLARKGEQRDHGWFDGDDDCCCPPRRVKKFLIPRPAVRRRPF